MWAPHGAYAGPAPTQAPWPARANAPSRAAWEPWDQASSTLTANIAGAIYSSKDGFPFRSDWGGAIGVPNDLRAAAVKEQPPFHRATAVQPVARAVPIVGPPPGLDLCNKVAGPQSDVLAALPLRVTPQEMMPELPLTVVTRRGATEPPLLAGEQLALLAPWGFSFAFTLVLDEEDEGYLVMDQPRLPRRLTPLVPKRATRPNTNFLVQGDVPLSVQTTIMIGMISAHLTRNGFIRQIKELGFEGCYDFIYFPLHFGTRRNKGCAFVNFVSNDAAQKFMEKNSPSKRRRWRLAWAHTQGYEANAKFAESERFRRVRANRYRPLLKGNPAFEAVTKLGPEKSEKDAQQSDTVQNPGSTDDESEAKSPPALLWTALDPGVTFL